MAVLNENSTVISAGDIVDNYVIMEVFSNNKGVSYFSVVRFPDGLRLYFNFEEIKAMLNKTKFKVYNGGRKDEKK